ncbi:hypothetical protein [Streptomyces venezuelae]|uniref:hypothetical protein n=1 Tax=Streptomyces venezuelae TaxID=54571 RepID=UPI00278C5251|nr:hypothetical protein [Streptomyces venezuelae]
MPTTIICHFPITVRITGTPSPATLERLGEVVEQALTARLSFARARIAAAGFTEIVPVDVDAGAGPDEADAANRSRAVP